MIKPLNSNFISTPIAHRGLHSDSVCENSTNAFDLAIKAHFPIEMDTHLLKDRKLVVFHDDNMKRVTSQDVNIETLTSEELNKYTLTMDNQKIPLFQDFLKQVNGQVPILIELKFGEHFDHNQADVLLEDLKDYPYKDKIALQSFNPFAVKYLKEHTDEYSVGYLCSYDLGNISKFKTYLCKTLKLLKYMKADFISYDINYLPNKYVKKYQKKGYQVLSWTINSPEKVEKGRKVADNLIFEKVKID